MPVAYAVCLNEIDCGTSDTCCGVTKKADGSLAPAGFKICVPSKGDGTVPNGLPLAGFPYSCPKPTPPTPVSNAF